MPGKVNPVIPEVVTQVAAQVIGNDAAITIGGMQGHFELNVFVPLMARNLLQSIKLLAAASRLLDEKCVAGIEANRERCESYAESDARPPRRRSTRTSATTRRARSSRRPLRRAARCARSRGRRVSRTTCSTRRSTTARWPSRTADISCPQGDIAWLRFGYFRLTMRRRARTECASFPSPHARGAARSSDRRRVERRPQSEQGDRQPPRRELRGSVTGPDGTGPGGEDHGEIHQSQDARRPGGDCGRSGGGHRRLAGYEPRLQRFDTREDRAEADSVRVTGRRERRRRGSRTTT